MLFLLILPPLFSGMYQFACHLLVEMWFPKLGGVPRYIIGTLGMAVPPTVAVVAGSLSGWMAVLVFWLSIAASGMSVVGIRKFGRKYKMMLDDLNELERIRQERKILLKRLEDAETEETG